jgi:hypothetical protein
MTTRADRRNGEKRQPLPALNPSVLVSPVGGPSIAVQPASIGSVLPLTWLAASEARKATALATSEGAKRYSAGGGAPPFTRMR